MSESTVIRSGCPSDFSPDTLTGVIGAGAREPVAPTVRAGVFGFLTRHGRPVDEDGGGRVVRHGTLPEREAMTGIGRTPDGVPRVLDRKAGVAREDGNGFRPSVVPPCLRERRSVRDRPPGFT